MTTAAVAAPAKGQYGSSELKRNYQRYWMIGFGIALAIHLGLIGTYYLAGIL